MIVTIDGPAGSGKSSTARAVARKLGFHHLDSGAFYRALTLAAIRAGIDESEWDDLSVQDLERLGVAASPAESGFRMTISGTDVGDDIRAQDVSTRVSRMARVPAVREWLLGPLRTLTHGVDLVADGRDMGTVVFPEAGLKVFLVAAPETRARRRLAELGNTDPTADELEAEVARLVERDRIDSERAVAPLRRAEDAIVVDTTDLDFDEQVDRIVELAAERR